jgi:hypothetical protein
MSSAVCSQDRRRVRARPDRLEDDTAEAKRKNEKRLSHCGSSQTRLQMR